MSKSNQIESIDPKTVNSKTERKVRAAMSQLILDSPFFSVLLQQQHLTYTLAIPTMATNGKSLYINPIFAESLPKEQITGVLVHELYHVIHLHCTRLNGRDPKIFNIACDYAINPMVKDDGFKLPEGHLDDPKFHGKLADTIYKELMQDQPEDLEPEHLDVLYNNNLTESEKSKIEQQTKIDITKAMTAAGKDVPKSIKNMIEEVLQPKVDWKLLLREFVQTSLGNDQSTWKRPNRNYLYKNIYLPSLEGTNMPSIAVMIDTSGSIYSNKELFKTFSGEINKIIEDFTPEAVDIFYVDTRIQKHDSYDEGEIPTYELVGGGGTCFKSAWPKMEANNPSCIIAFTDCWASFPEHSEVDTLWITYQNKDAKPPFGKVVYAEE